MEDNSGTDEENTADQKKSNRSILGQLRVSQSRDLLLVRKTSVEEEEDIFSACENISPATSKEVK